MKVLIENIKEVPGKTWDAMFDIVLVVDNYRTIRIIACGIEKKDGQIHLRIPTKISNESGQVYQIVFFDHTTWKEIKDKVRKTFGGVDCAADPKEDN